MSVSEEFWKNADLQKLGEHWNYKQRLSYDIQKILPHIRRYKNVADIACGEAKVIINLNNILDFESIYLYDINEMVVFKTLISTPLNFNGEHGNLNEYIPSEVTDTDMVTWLGGITYIVDDDRAEEIICSMKNIIIRTTCYDEEIYVNKFSDDFNTNYEAKYRTKNKILSWLNKYFNSVKYEKIYPKSLETKYGGITYLFVGENRSG